MSAAKQALSVNGKAIPLAAGLTLSADQFGSGLPAKAVCRIESNPKNPNELVLVNVSDRPWVVRAPNGEQRSIPTQGRVRAEHGRQIDFGPATGTIADGVDAKDLVSIDRDAMWTLSRKLLRAAEERLLNQEQFDRLHQRFYAHDPATGYGWSVGLRDKLWIRWESARWVEGTPPPTLLINPETLKELEALAASLRTRKPSA